jgi:arylsulfatase
MRVPMIVRWPGHVPQGRVSDKVVTALDLAPTLLAMTGVTKKIDGVDGRDVSDLMLGRGEAALPDAPFFYFWERELRAVRQGRWKLQLEHIDAQTPDPEGIGHGGVRGQVTKVARSQALYDLTIDPNETNDMSNRYPDRVRAMLELAKKGKTPDNP